MPNPLVSIIEDDARRAIADLDLGVLDGKSILVTGASGLIGTHLIACLREEVRSRGTSIDVVALVHSPSSPPLELFLDFNGVRIIQGDVSDTTFVRGLGSFDYIVHAAGYGQPGRFMENAVKTLALNSTATIELLGRLNAGGRFLFISTSELYSGLPTPPFHEEQIGTTTTTHPRACYIEGKRGGETACNVFRDRGVFCSSARLALAYGPGTKPSDRRVLNSFVERAILQRRIVMQDHGLAKRTYCYVSDAVEILWHVLLKGTRPIYNVGGFSRTTIAELARTIGGLLDAPVELPREAHELGGAPDDVYLDMSLVEREFGKTRYVSLSDGLARTVDWQKALYMGVGIAQP